MYKWKVRGRKYGRLDLVTRDDSERREEDGTIPPTVLMDDDPALIVLVGALRGVVEREDRDGRDKMTVSIAD
jgi:hypothetical protein